MLFGSDEMRNLLIRSLNEPAIYQDVMDQVYESVKAYTLDKIKEGFKSGEVAFESKPISTEIIEFQDYGDIINDVMCRVICSLDKFIINIMQKDYTEAQRQAWLRRIIYNSLASYLSKKGKTISPLNETELKKYSDEKIPDTRFGFYDVHLESTLKAILKIACGAPSKPEKVMAYIFNAIIFREISGHEKRGAAKATGKYMYGKQLYALKNSMLHAFKQVFDVRITNEDIKPLSDIVGIIGPTQAGKAIFMASPKMVSDWTNRIKTHVFKYKAQIYGEEGESDVRKK